MEINMLMEKLMFERFKNKRVLVTGPQRSGTTICARMIANDADIEYIDEDFIAVDDIARAEELFLRRKGFVLQAPGLAHICHKIDADVVVFMIRPVDEIIESPKDIGWGCEDIELSKYSEGGGVISEVKYKYWENQKTCIKCPVEVHYHDLKEHQMWLCDRDGWSARQWRDE